jgi:23S rRNA pseudouridine1911/1915/1917 synthase
LSGGNAPAVAQVMDALQPQGHLKNYIIENHLETKTLLRYQEELLQIKSHTRASDAVVETMRRARFVNLDERPAAEIRQEDFRKLGVRLENPLEGVGERLDAYMGKTFPFQNRKVWNQRVLNGEVTIEHKAPMSPPHTHQPKRSVVKPTYRMQMFDQIWMCQPHEHEPESLEDIAVVYDDGDLCVFSKPPNMVIHQAGVYGKNTLVHRLEAMGYGNCAAVHRIDRETSGAIVCARQKHTRHALSLAFRHGQVNKKYLAVTRCMGGAPLPDTFTVDTPIGEAQGSKIRLKLWVNGPNSQDAVTECEVLARYKEFCLVACIPKTGRTNQIRIHLASLGHPLVGDKMYHPDENVFLEFYEKGYTPWVAEQTLFPRHMLHNLEFQVSQEIYPPFPGDKPIVAPLAADMLESEIVRELLERAKDPATPHPS